MKDGISEEKNYTWGYKMTSLRITDKKIPSNSSLVQKFDLLIKRIEQKKPKLDTLVSIEGAEGCLTGDTIIPVSKNKGSRKYKLDKLYKNFCGKGDKRWDNNISCFVRSFNGKEIKLNKLKNVTYSGKKKVYLMELENGNNIKATSNHKFLTKDSWTALENLKEGMEIMCDKLNASSKKRKRIKLYDITLRVDYHPFGKRVEVHRLIYEARMNNMEFTEYLDILLNEPETAKRLKYINPQIYDIHHKDGNHYNNSVENLEKINKQKHSTLHGK
jgi:intein/homing endonuclease